MCRIPSIPGRRVHVTRNRGRSRLGKFNLLPMPHFRMIILFADYLGDSPIFCYISFGWQSIEIDITYVLLVHCMYYSLGDSPCLAPATTCISASVSVQRPDWSGLHNRTCYHNCYHNYLFDYLTSPLRCTTRKNGQMCGTLTGTVHIAQWLDTTMESDQSIYLFEMLFAGKVMIILTFISILAKKRHDWKQDNSLFLQSRKVEQFCQHTSCQRKTNNEEYEEIFDLSALSSKEISLPTSAVQMKEVK